MGKKKEMEIENVNRILEMKIEVKIKKIGDIEVKIERKEERKMGFENENGEWSEII